MRHFTILLALVVLPALAFAQPPAQKTTLEDQSDLAVTAYNNNLALVRDVRTLDLPTGELHLTFMDVAEQIRPETVGLRSLNEEGSVVILEQNYEYDLISPQKLMEKYVGEKVTLRNYNADIGFSEVQAKLLSTNGGPVYEVGGQIWLGHPGQVVLPDIPKNLIAKPSLIWTLQNQAANQTLEATYLTGGISWQADYVLTLAKDDASLDIAGWVTMNNQSGATYTNAKLKLVAGEVNVVRDQTMGFGGGDVMLREAKAMAAPMPEEEAFAEYHLYTMPRRTTIKQNQSKQLALLGASGVKSAKIYELRGREHFYSQRMPQLRDQKVAVFLEFRNDEENQMGMPLPAGTMRIYQEDSEGMLQFAGEDRIEHTPKDEDVRLKMGTAFDLVAERTQTDYQRISDRVHQSAYEIVLRNHKETDVVIDVVEPMPGDWQILEKSQDFDKKDARTAVFSVPVPADGEATVTYRVQVKW